MDDTRTSETLSVEERGTSQDRRRHPRVPANLPVLIMAAGRIMVGRTRDASEGGLAVAVTPPPSELPGSVTVALRLPTRGWTELDGEIVRREPGDGASELLGIRLFEADADAAPRERRRLRSGGAERIRPCHPGVGTEAGAAFDAELRALATLVYEQALNEPRARPLRSLVVWANHLRTQIGVEPSEPASYRDLLKGLAAMHRCSDRPGTRRRHIAPTARREPPER